MASESWLSQRAELLVSLLKDDTLDLDSALARFNDQARGPEVQMALGRATALRSFDQPAFDALIAPGASLSFEELVRLPEIGQVPGEAGRYWAAGPSIASAQTTPPQQVVDSTQFHRDAEAFFAEPEHADALARLHHLIAFDSSSALGLFQEEFDRADSGFDLSRCNALLDVLRSNKTRLGPELSRARARGQTRLASRSLFADAYYRTGSYLERPQLIAAFNSVLDGTERWILHLHATGGMGKTIFLRWLIARRLVPQGVPCARIDLDEVSLDALNRRPWLILLPICEQLNPQLPSDSLTGILESAPPYQVALRPSGAGVGTLQEDNLDRLAAAHDTDAGSSLAREIGAELSRSGVERVVVVLDTLELATVFPDTCRRLFEPFAELHRACPQLRMVLSGRYRLDLKVPELAGDLSTGAAEFHLSRFADEEATAYVELRKIQGRRLIEAMVAKVREPGTRGTAGSNPFKLALLADLVLSQEGADEAFVRSLPSADYQYLLARVIDRIPEQPLRWVVRYGAIPRLLSFDYLKSVLIPRLAESLSGQQAADAPTDLERWPNELAAIAGQAHWQQAPEARIDAEALWADLQRYESPQGWITHSATKGDRRGFFRFHTDVVLPMRDLLSYQPIFDQLQRESARYFEREADEHRNRFLATGGDDSARRETLLAWARSCCDAVFHRIQQDPEDGIRFWNALFDDPLATDPEVRWVLARELLSHDYAEDEERPRLRAGRALVGVPDLIQAHLATAESLEALLRTERPPGFASWSQVSRHAQVARRLGGQTLSVAEAARLRLLDGAFQAGKGHHAEAVSTLRPLVAESSPGGLDEGHRAVAAWHLAESAAASHDRGAESVAFEILASQAGGRRPALPPVLQDRLIRRYLADGREAEVRGLLHAAVTQRIAAGDGPVPAPELIKLAVIELGIADYDAALALLAHLRERSTPRLAPDQAAGVLCLGAEAWSSLAYVPAGLSNDLAEAEGRTTAPELKVRLAHSRALLAAAELNLNDASEHWDRAERDAERLSLFDLLLEIRLNRARLANRVGRYREAMALAGASTQDGADRKAAEIALELALAMARGDRSEAARATIDHAQNRADSSGWRQVQGRALALGLALGLYPPATERFEQLRALLKVAQPTERHLIFAPLVHARHPIAPPPGWLDAVGVLLAEGENVEANPIVAALGRTRGAIGAVRRGLVRVELERVFGEGTRAMEIIESLPLDRELAGLPVGTLQAPLRLLVEEACGRLAGARPKGALLPKAPEELPKSLASAALLVESLAPGLTAGLETLLGLVSRHDVLGWLGGLQASKVGAWVAGLDLTSLQSVLDLAIEVLNAESRATRWSAMAAEFGGWLAMAAGKNREGQILLAKAATLLDQLGDAETQRQLRGRLERAAVQLGSAPGATLEATVPESGATGERLLTPRGPLAEMDAPALALWSTKELPERLAQNWRALARELRESLLNEEDLAAIPNAREPLGLRLAASGPLAGLPWELAALPGEDEATEAAPRIRYLVRVIGERSFADADAVRFVQQCLALAGSAKLPVDGSFGPLTRAAVTDFQRARGLGESGRIDAPLIETLTRIRQSAPGSPEPLRVLLVQPDLNRSGDDRLSYTARTARPLEDYYKEAGIKAVCLQGKKVTNLAKEVANIQPHAIHLVAAVRELGGTVVVDLAQRRSQSESESLTSTALADLTAHLPLDRLRPLLILDIPRPSGTLECVRAVVRRNLLASQIMQLHAYSGILGAGLEPPERLGRLAGTLAQGIATGLPLSTLALAVRRLYADSPHPTSEDDLNLALAYRGSALFAESPELPCALSA